MDAAKKQQPLLHSGQMETAVVSLMNYRLYIIVPNVYWGWNLRHEADLICVNPKNFVTEIEIKISASDLKADFKKGHTHDSKRIHRLVYAVPENLVELCLSLVQPCHGVISVSFCQYRNRYVAKWVRGAKKNKNPPIDMQQLNQLLRLAAMRIWSLKNHNNNRLWH